MTEDGGMELIRLVDAENSVIVRVTGPTTAVRPWDGCLDVDIVVASAFANGHLTRVCLLPEDLDDWAERLDLLAAGEPVEWMDDGRNPEIQITPTGPYTLPEGRAAQRARRRGERPHRVAHLGPRPGAAAIDTGSTPSPLRLARVRTAWPFAPR